MSRATRKLRAAIQARGVDDLHIELRYGPPTDGINVDNGEECEFFATGGWEINSMLITSRYNGWYRIGRNLEEALKWVTQGWVDDALGVKP